MMLDEWPKPICRLLGWTAAITLVGATTGDYGEYWLIGLGGCFYQFMVLASDWNESGDRE